MTIVMVGVCVDGMVRRDAVGVGADGRPQQGITSPQRCEKCGGAGCPRTARARRTAEGDGAAE